MRELKFKFVFRHPDGEIIITPAYTIDEILQTSIEDIQDTWINCDCVPVGENNYVECNCDERFGQFQLIDKLQFTGIEDCNGCYIYDGHIVNHFGENMLIVNRHGSWYHKHRTDEAYGNLHSIHYPYAKLEKNPYYEVIGNIYENPELLNQ